MGAAVLVYPRNLCAHLNCEIAMPNVLDVGRLGQGHRSLGSREPEAGAEAVGVLVGLAGYVASEPQLRAMNPTRVTSNISPLLTVHPPSKKEGALQPIRMGGRVGFPPPKPARRLYDRHPAV